MLGGEIRVESEEGRGSSFYFTIPYGQQTQPEEMEVKTNISKNHFSSHLTILIAEDEESSIMYLTELLEGKCKKLLFAKSGAEAIEISKKNPDIDIILMDIKMPEMDGYTATRRIRKFNQDVIIIAQTAYALTGDRQNALEAGCNDYISKPIKKELLISLIAKHMQMAE